MSTLAILWLIFLVALKISAWLVPTLIVAVVIIRIANARDDARAVR